MHVHRANEGEGQFGFIGGFLLFGDIKPNLLWVVCIYVYLPLCKLVCGLEKNLLETEWLKENIKSKVTVWLTAVVSVQYVSLCPEPQ